jgi:hypothetical protein
LKFDHEAAIKAIFNVAERFPKIWLAIAVATLISKTSEEMVADGYENGNRKIMFPDNYMRFGEGLDPDDYINLNFDGVYSRMTELGTAKQMREEQKIGKSGFMVDNSEDGAPVQGCDKYDNVLNDTGVEF